MFLSSPGSLRKQRQTPALSQLQRTRARIACPRVHRALGGGAHDKAGGCKSRHTCSLGSHEVPALARGVREGCTEQGTLSWCQALYVCTFPSPVSFVLLDSLERGGWVWAGFWSPVHRMTVSMHLEWTVSVGSRPGPTEPARMVQAQHRVQCPPESSLPGRFTQSLARTKSDVPTSSRGPV